MDRHDEPIACTLSAEAAARQVQEWSDVHRHVQATEEVPGGYLVTIDGAVADAVEDLAAREARCCGFLDISTDRVAGAIRLRLTTADPTAMPLIDLLVGRAR